MSVRHLALLVYRAASTGRIYVKFGIRDCMDIYREHPDLVKIVQT
jgi:hypothetical protein